MREFLERGESALATVRAAIANPAGHFTIAKSSVIMKAPIYDAPKVICVGMNYVDHCTEQNFPIPTEPIIFNKFPSTIIAPNEPVLKSNLTDELDFEVELVIVIGKEGRYISKEKAEEHVVNKYIIFFILFFLISCFVVVVWVNHFFLISHLYVHLFNIHIV